MSESRFTPQHRFWEEDLELREAAILGNAKLYDDLSSADGADIVLTRATNIMRGGLLLFASIFFVLTIVFGLSVVTHMGADAIDFPVATMVIVAGIFAMVGLVVFGFRLDLRMPRDTPIRFNRLTGKVQALEYIWNWNPFGRWHSELKEFDWSNVQAELQKQAGVSGGGVYIVRYALVLCICKPETYEVVDRVTLKSNRITTEDLKQIWNYLRRYMTEGPDKLPHYTPKPQGVSLRRSFFQYMRWFDPTAEGREFRKDMPVWLIGINTVLSILTFWILIPLGLFHYVAMRFAPAVKWPREGT